jgi:hypothetical protein
MHARLQKKQLQQQKIIGILKRHTILKRQQRKTKIIINISFTAVTNNSIIFRIKIKMLCIFVCVFTILPAAVYFEVCERDKEKKHPPRSVVKAAKRLPSFSYLMYFYFDLCSEILHNYC